MDHYVLLSNFISDIEIEKILSISKKYTEKDSKVGVTVQKNRKIRKDIFYSGNDVNLLDSIIFPKVKKIVKPIFNKDIEFRESYKLGRYYGDQGGFYNPHSDNQGGMEYRKISAIICLTDINEYEGGVFKFVDIKREYRFTKGDIILFNSNMMHGVEPVTGGLREVMICFFFDMDGLYKKATENYQKIISPQLISENTKRYSPLIKLHTRKGEYIKCSECDAWNKDSSKQHQKQIHDEQMMRQKILQETKNKQLSENGQQPYYPKSQQVANKSPPFLMKYKDIAGTQNLIYPILPDSGPGNQIVGLKETLILSRLLNRICVIPPVREHYLANKEKNKLFFIRFKELYKLNIPNTLIDDNLEMNIQDVENIYSINPVYHKKLLHNERLLKKDPKINEILLQTRKIQNENDLNELKSKEDSLLILKHIFNNVTISECNNNGCNNCGINKHFIKLYRDICSRFDFSDMIKEYGDQFIQENLTEKYIAIHIRYPDVMNQKSLEEHTNGLFSEDMIYKVIEEKYLETYSIFIATNKPELIQKSKLNKCVLLDINSKYSNWIEQYICAKSDLYYGCPFNDYSKINQIHVRSTWNSFVRDYRNYLLKKPVSKTLLITDLVN